MLLHKFSQLPFQKEEVSLSIFNFYCQCFSVRTSLVSGDKISTLPKIRPSKIIKPSCVQKN